MQRIRERTQRREKAAAARYKEAQIERRTYTRGDLVKNCNLMLDALASPVRRKLLWRLRSEGAMSLTKLGRPFRMKLPHAQKHILVLERSGLVTTHKRGRVRMCVYNQVAMQELTSWLLSARRD